MLARRAATRVVARAALDVMRCRRRARAPSPWRPRTPRRSRRPIGGARRGPSPVPAGLAPTVRRGASTRTPREAAGCTCPAARGSWGARTASRSDGVGGGRAPGRRQSQDARILAFCASNSASVRIPWDLSSASSFSCDTVSGAAAGAGGGACSYCCCAYCWSSCCAQRLACRRETRFETAVAVPATTAVRATPRRSPGMVMSSFGWSLVRLVERCEERVLRDVARRHELRATSPQRLRERSRPAVLEDQDAGRRARVDHGCGVVEVAAVEEARRRTLEHRQVHLAVPVEVAQLDGSNRAVGVPPDEHEVEDPDQTPVDEVDEDRKALTGHLTPRELDNQVADRPQRFVRHVPDPPVLERSGVCGREFRARTDSDGSVGPGGVEPPSDGL